jgi:GT2 family glycosyltransferase
MGLLKLTSESSLDLERGSVVVAIPVHNGYDHVVESVAAALRHTAVDVPICIINDGSSDERIELFIEELGGSSDLEHRLYYLSHHANRGFVESCNEAFDLFAPADVVLLNSDCVVSEGWLERMRSAAASDARVATVSVMANSATMISVPERNTPTDGLPAALTLDEAARAVGENALGSRPEIPTAIGHCVLIRRSALELVGGFDPIFSPGYGEEVDFAQRCLIVGLKHVMADDVYVLHHGGVSFAGQRERLQTPHDRIVHERYPWYLEAVHHAQMKTEGPLDTALLNASVGLRRPRVTIDGAGLNASRTGTQLHTLGVIASLARSEQVELRVLVPAHLDADVAELIAELGPIELLPHDAVDDETERSDIVHRPFQVTKPSDLEFLRRLGHRVVVSQLDQIAFHNPYYFESAAAWVEYRQTTIDALANVDLALFISQHSADDAIDNGLIDRSRTDVIHLGVEQLLAGDGLTPEAPALVGQLEGAPFLLCLGTNFSHKNRVFAIRLLASLRSRGWNGWLIFAGPHAASGTSEQAEQEQLEYDPATASRVIDAGAVSESEKLWLLSSTAAVVYPTTHEGFGLVPFEAAAAGAPCIFASHTSLAELFPADVALITAWDEEETASAVLPLLTDGPEREQHVRALLEAGESLTWQAYGSRLIDSYRAVLKRASPAYSLLTRQGQGAVSREGYWLVGPDGLLDERYERPLLAISSRPALAFIFLRPLEWGYRMIYSISRLLRPNKRAADVAQESQPNSRSADRR